MTMPATGFDQMFASSDDPWGFRRHWYEARKRALTLAILPHARYAVAFEPGCANGELSAALAGRCDQLIASDYSEKALALARDRVRSLANVSVELRAMPDQWPHARRFDLIVFSEFLYYLSAADISALFVRAAASLNADGVLLLCDWRRPLGHPHDLDVPGIHAMARALDGLHSVAHYEDDDMLIDVLSPSGESVAQREGLA